MGNGRLQSAAQMIVLNAFVLLGWSFFMTQDLTVTIELLRGGVGLNGLSFAAQSWSMPVLAWSALAFGIVMIVSGRAESADLVGSPKRWKAIAFSILIVLGLLMLGSSPEFLYAQF